MRRFYSLRELYEADFHKPGIHGSGRVCAKAWDVFRRTRLEVVAVAGLLWILWCVLDAAGFFRVFFFPFFFLSSNAHGLLQV